MSVRKKAMKESEFLDKLEDGELDSEQVKDMLPHFYWKGFRSAIAWLISILIIGVALGTLVFLLLTRIFGLTIPYNSKDVIGKKELKKVDTLTSLLKQYYYEDVEDEDIRNGIYYGIMASAGDPYTCYYTEEEWKKMTEDLSGVFCGIGASLQMDTERGYIKIVSVFDDSPAAKGGVQIGDYIIKVDGEDMYGFTSTDVVSRVRGEDGTEVTLNLERDGKEIITTLTRAPIDTPTVSYEMKEDGIAYIRITEFDDVTTKQFKDAKSKMLADNAEGLILDLRGNPGGNIDAVTAIANEIIPKGIIVYTEDKYGKRRDYLADGKGEINIPMVVLIDGGSASASEILAGAIKDYQKGILMGTTTFGKGIVQSLLQLGDGTAVKITVSKYYTPSGVNIHKTGIEPDELVPFDPDAYTNDNIDNQLESAIEYLKMELHINNAADDAAA